MRRRNREGGRRKDAEEGLEFEETTDIMKTIKA